MVTKTEDHVRRSLHALLAESIERSASDLFLKTGGRPCLRIDGAVRFLEVEPISQAVMVSVEAIVLGERRSAYVEEGELDLAYEAEGVGRFRVSFYRQRGRTSVAFRHVPRAVPSFEELGLPVAQLTRLSEQREGLVLVTGATGSGKSTTLAAMVDYINESSPRHIVTVEDPVEFVHEDKQCLIDQREVGLDTSTFGRALKHVVRQSPDVILIGEMRDAATIRTAVNAAEIGHLVLSTLHTANTIQTLERVLSHFPSHERELMLLQLSNTVQGFIAQRLLRRADGKGRIPAVEIMMRSPTVSDLIRKHASGELEAALSEDRYYGSRTFQQALGALYRSGRVSLEEALSASSKPQELKNSLQGLSLGKGG